MPEHVIIFCLDTPQSCLVFINMLNKHVTYTIWQENAMMKDLMFDIYLLDKKTWYIFTHLTNKHYMVISCGNNSP